MKLQELINRTRGRLTDEEGPISQMGWDDQELADYASDAERELARRLFLLHDSDTIGHLSLSGTAGQVDSVVVSSVTITSGAVAYSSSLEQTARNLAANINAHSSSPNYRAAARGKLVIVKAMPNTGYPASGYTLTTAVSGGMGASATNLPGLCRHVLSIGQRYLTLNNKVFEITRFKPASQSRAIGDAKKTDLDASSPGWETLPNGTIIKFIPDYEGYEVIVMPPPSAVELVEQDCYRLPLADFTIDDLQAVPEIGEQYHIAMVDWMVRLAYLKDDAETHDLVRSLASEKEFERRVERWKRDNIKRSSDGSVNRIPGGFL